jgi:2-haloacid dehalogenase
MRLHGIPWSPSDGDALVAAVPAFGPFPEVPGALRALKARYAISIIATNLV